MKKKRIKCAAAPMKVPQSAQEANAFIAQIGDAQRAREVIQTAMNEAMARLKESYEAQARPLAEGIESLTRGLQIWCEANRNQLTQGNRVTYQVKYHRFAAGEISWRLRPRSVFVRKVEEVLHQLHMLRLQRFIRVKEEINKEAMLADPAAANQIPGVRVSSPGEEFVVKPFETALEEVGYVTVELTEAGRAAAGSVS